MIQAKQFLSRGIWQPRRRNAQMWPCAPWAKPADHVAATQFMEEIQTFIRKADSSLNIVENSSVRALIACLGGNSPYLSDLVRDDIAGFITLLEKGPQHYTQAVFAESAEFDPNTGREEVTFFLRTLKKK